MTNKKKYVFTFIGDGPDTNYLCDLLKKQQIEWYYLGPLNDSKVIRELASSDYLILPSFSEGTPTVILEALSLGIPVVTSNVGGIPEIVNHGDNGWMFDIDRPAELTKILDSLNKPDGEFRQRCQRSVLAHDIHNVVEQHLAIYQNLLAMK